MAVMALVGLCSLMSTMAAAAAPVEVHYLYTGPASWKGEFVGQCDAAGIEFPSDRDWRLSLTSDGGQLLIRRARVNVTTLLLEGQPREFHQPFDLWEAAHRVPPGPMEVAWGRDGIGSAFGHNLSRGPGHDLKVAWRASSLDASAVGNYGVMEGVWAKDEFGMFYSSIGFPGWNRQLGIDGHAHAAGGVSFYLRRATVESSAGQVALPPFRTIESDVSTPAAKRQTIIFTDAYLHLQDARFRLASSNAPVCKDITGSHTGTFAAAIASGNATAGEERLEFTDRVLTLEGAFDVDEKARILDLERGRDGRIEATSSGAINIVGTDFAAQLVQPLPVDLPRVGLVALMLAALAAFLYKSYASTLTFLYSRLTRDRVLDQARRDQVYQLIRQKPGIALKELKGASGLWWSTLTYHVEVLKRAGLIAQARHGVSWRLFTKETGTVPTPKQIALTADARMTFLHGRLNQGPVPLRDAVQALRQQFGVSLARAYATVNDAARLGIVRKERSAQGLVISLAV